MPFFCIFAQYAQPLRVSHPLYISMRKTKEALLVLAANAALDAGKAIMEVYGGPDSGFQIEAKSDDSPLTLADKKSNDVLLGQLAGTGIPVLSEESVALPYSSRKQWGSLWVVDPLDGTKEFIKRNGEFTVNVALVEGGSAVLGVIYAPVAGELYWGLKDSGSGKAVCSVPASPFPDYSSLVASSMPLPLSSTGEMPVVVASRSHLNSATEEFIASLRQRHGDVELVSKGSSLKFCLVAEGSADVYPRFAPTMEWDTAAGQAIAEAAGCRVVLPGGDEPLAYNKENLLNPWFVAYNPKMK